MGGGRKPSPVTDETQLRAGPIFLRSDFSCFTSEAYRLHYARLFFSSIHDPNQTHTIPWRRRINEQTEVSQPGLGYPVSVATDACRWLQKEGTCGAATTATATAPCIRTHGDSVRQSEHNRKGRILHIVVDNDWCDECIYRPGNWRRQHQRFPIGLSQLFHNLHSDGQRRRWNHDCNSSNHGHGPASTASTATSPSQQDV